MSEPLVSVITPVFDGEEYLEEAMESVLAQRYRNFEYVVVDNMSRDGSRALADRIAARDARVRVVSAEVHLPMVPNFNRALRMIAPESVYTKMLLADDRLEPDCLPAMVEVGEAHPSAGLIGAHRLEEDRVSCDGLAPPETLFAGREVARRSLAENFYVFGSPTTLMYRSSVVRARDPFFSETSPHEDTEACYEILREHDFATVHRVLSFTRRQNESETNARNHFDREHRLDRLIAATRYAPDFFSAEEARALVAREERAYYSFMAWRSLRDTGPAFWEYHRRGLESCGARLDRARLLRGQLRVLGGRLRDPANLARAVKKRLMGQSTSESEVGG